MLCAVRWGLLPPHTLHLLLLFFFLLLLFYLLLLLSPHSSTQVVASFLYTLLLCLAEGVVGADPSSSPASRCRVLRVSSGSF